MSAMQRRRGSDSETAAVVSLAASTETNIRPLAASALLRAEVRRRTAPTVDLVTPDAKPERPRCVRCGHPLALPRSVARAYGAKCWRRTAVAQLDARRDALGRVLSRVARRVAVLDAAGLAIVTTALRDVLASLDATGATV
jgi:Family of unknown function (DUF6011)